MPHTKHQIQELLSEIGRSPRRRYGQNFLIDLNLMRLLVSAAAIRPDDVVLEVGCGTGSLTELLAQQAGAVVAVEIDNNLAGIAKEQLEAYDNVTIVLTDILKNKSTISPDVSETVALCRDRFAGRFLLVANLPYQVGSPLMIDLLLCDMMPDGMFVTVQAEVGYRMAASAGSKAYGLMSILMGAVGDVELLRKVGSQAFWPMPDVGSAMVAWRRNDDKCRQIKDLWSVKRVVELVLGHRRKKISSCLAGLDCDIAEVFKKVGVDGQLRGEALTVEQYVALGNELQKNVTANEREYTLI